MVISAMVMGLVAGLIGRALVPRQNTVRGCFPTMAVGLGGAMVGWLIFTKGFGIGDDDIFDWGGFIGAVVGSVLVLVVLGAIAQGQRRGPASRV